MDPNIDSDSGQSQKKKVPLGVNSPSFYDLSGLVLNGKNKNNYESSFSSCSDSCVSSVSLNLNPGNPQNAFSRISKLVMQQ